MRTAENWSSSTGSQLMLIEDIELEPGASHDDWPAGLQYLRELQGQTAMSAENALKVVKIKYQLCNNCTLEG